MRVHTVKCWPNYFQAVKAKRKTFELRNNDRHYASGDVLIMQEWDPKTRKYTGEKSRHGIGWITDLGDGNVILSLMTPTISQMRTGA